MLTTFIYSFVYLILNTLYISFHIAGMLMLHRNHGLLSDKTVQSTTGWLVQLAERRSLAGELTLFYPRPVADG